MWLGPTVLGYNDRMFGWGDYYSFHSLNELPPPKLQLGSPGRPVLHATCCTMLHIQVSKGCQSYHRHPRATPSTASSR